MKLTVKSDREERKVSINKSPQLLYVGEDAAQTINRIHKQAMDLGFTTTSKYLKALSHIPSRRLKEIFNSK
jgi:hypothetical protein